jgi:predicted nucleic acid-binding protein
MPIPSLASATSLRNPGSTAVRINSSLLATSSMTGPIFVDTNVLVYVRDRTDPEKQRRAAEWMAALWDGGAGRLSLQVLQEYYVTLTRKLDPPRSRDEARDDVGTLGAWKPLPISPAVLEAAWDVEDRYGISFWDALIVGAAHHLGCAWLLSEDLQDGQEILGIRVVNPFRHRPDTVLGGRSP